MIVLPHRRKAFQPTGGGSTLLNGLLHWWDLDEASGDAIDATGNQDLTDTNTVGSSSGTAPDGGDARSFTAANSEYFTTAAGNILNNSETAVTFALWGNVNNTSLNKTAFTHNAPNGYSALQMTTSEYAYMYFDAGLTRYKIANQAGAWHSFICTSAGAPSGPDYLYIDNVEAGAGTNTKGFESGSGLFRIGVNQYGTNEWDGEMCSFAIWDRVLTAAERAEFHNSGTNLRYADL